MLLQILDNSAVSGVRRTPHGAGANLLCSLFKGNRSAPLQRSQIVPQRGLGHDRRIRQFVHVGGFFRPALKFGHREYCVARKPDGAILLKSFATTKRFRHASRR
ncbi:hypothetical protein CU048_14430 [Beijerinckiaceae bacterium]|nr:hypothetical protein CU048_14430 [Beijerinckiaceae bacterium]